MDMPVQRVEQSATHLRDFIRSIGEGFLVGTGKKPVEADLAGALQRGGSGFSVGDC